MYHNHLTDILFLAANHNYRFVPSAGPDWKEGFDRGKQPLKSIHEATTDPAVLTAWAERYRNCNWLFVPGDGQAVLDIDPRHGGDVLLAELEREHGPLPRTPRVRTGRGDGGSHRHFVVPSGSSFDRNLLGNAGLTLACGEKHGFVIPPCRHALGGQYVWELPPWDADPAPCPGWLLALADEKTPLVPRTPAPVAAEDDMDGGDLEFVWSGGKRLATHPGSVAKALGGEGRRPTLVSLLGRELGLGRSADDLEPEALAWAGRCTPPLDEREALKHLHSMARRDAARHGDGRQHPTTRSKPEGQRGTVSAGAGERRNPVAVPAVGPAEPVVPSLAAGPPALHADALHGLAGELVRAVGPATEADKPAVLLSFLTAFGSAAGFAPRWDHSKPHGANLFVLLVGPTSARKGTAWGVGAAAVRQADPGWAEECVAAEGFGSGEGVVWAIRDPAPAVGDAAAADAGVADKRLLVVEQEFSKPLRLARQKESILAAIIRAAFDRERLGKRNKGASAYRATDPHVGIVGHITADELRAELHGSQHVANGLVNRFLICDTRRTKFIPRRGRWPEAVAPFVGRVREALDHAKGTGLLELDDEAGAVWDGLYAELETRPDTTFGRATGRASDYCMKVALVYALLDAADAIRLPHLKAGLAVWRYSEASARVVFGGGEEKAVAATAAPPEEPLAVRVLGLIQARPGVGRTQMHEHLGNRVKAGALDEALAWLEAGRHAHRRSVSTGGRPAECWWPGPDPEGGAGEGRHPPADGPAGDLPSFVWAAPAEAMVEHPADATADVPSLAEAGEGLADGVVGVVPPDTGPGPCPSKYPDAEALDRAIRASGGRVVKHDDGRCELELVKPDPDIEAGWQRWQAEIAATYLTENQFFAELERDRPRRPAA